MNNSEIKNKRLTNDEFYLIKKEFNESKFIILSTEKITWFYGEFPDLILGFAKLINNLENVSGGSDK